MSSSARRAAPGPRPVRPHFTPPGPVAGFLADLLLGLLRRLSARGRVRLAHLVAWAAWTLRVRRRVTLDNLRHAFPEKPEGERRAIARSAYAHMALAALEALTSVDLTEAQLAQVLRTPGGEKLAAAVHAGTGALVASAHFGSWELFAEVMSRRGYPVAAVVKPLRGALNARIVQHRLAAGMTLISPRGALQGMLAALARGQLVAVLIDQVLPARHGVFVPFFGRPACTNPAVSLAALRSGAPVFVAVTVREGDGLRLVLEGPLPPPHTGDREADVRAHTAQLTAVLERIIRRHPEQWMWLHRRWKVQPPPPPPGG